MFIYKQGMFTSMLVPGPRYIYRINHASSLHIFPSIRAFPPHPSPSIRGREHRPQTGLRPLRTVVVDRSGPPVSLARSRKAWRPAT